ncbi:hypothetical protein ACGFZH_20370 [Streptomyces zaomyceticus]|uniref:hypothetical protein n=1 Tax=Streptomyces TaxID=1883 RepID=UPI003711611D
MVEDATDLATSVRRSAPHHAHGGRVVLAAVAPSREGRPREQVRAATRRPPDGIHAHCNPPRDQRARQPIGRAQTRHLSLLLDGISRAAAQLGVTPVPPATLIGVAALDVPEHLVEIEATAVLD